jgi:hypothetical protein
MANPTRRMRRHRRRRRRNPGGMGRAIGTFLKVGIPSVMAGGLFGLVDSKLLADKSAIIRVAGKIGTAAALGLVFRKNPLLAISTMSGILGTIGYEQAINLSGGMVAPTPAAAVKGINALIRDDPQTMGVLIQGMRGMGLQLDSQVSLGSQALDVAPADRFVDVNLG